MIAVASLQAVYDGLVASTPFLIPGLEFIAPSDGIVYRPLSQEMPLVFHGETSLYFWHCEFERNLIANVEEEKEENAENAEKENTEQAAIVHSVVHRVVSPPLSRAKPLLLPLPQFFETEEDIEFRRPTPKRPASRRERRRSYFSTKVNLG